MGQWLVVQGLHVTGHPVTCLIKIEVSLGSIPEHNAAILILVVRNLQVPSQDLRCHAHDCLHCKALTHDAQKHSTSKLVRRTCE